jgi:uncharacterized membrane protein YedE/YeeE
MSDAEFLSLTQQVLWGFFALAFVAGFISQRTHFCTMGAIADVVNIGDWTRARQWMLAIGVAMIGFAVLAGTGQIDASKTLYAGNRLLWLSCAVGGGLFGYGMVIASGCGNKTLVRIGGGNLKSVVVFVVMGVSAFATLKGITAVLRVNTVDAVALDLPFSASVPGVLAGWLGLSPDSASLWAGLLIGAWLVVSVLRHAEFRQAENLVAGLGIGAAIAVLWWVSGHFGFVPEHPQTLEPVYVATSSGRIEALSFIAPVGQTLDWLMFFSDKSKVVNAGIVAVLGVILGAMANALLQGTFRWEGFANTRDLAQHLIGAVMMGVGGITGLGCTFGQGLSGLSTLSLNAVITVAAIIAGAVLALRHQVARLERELG